MKTKREIIEEVANSYTLSTRSMSNPDSHSSSGCSYLNPKGLMCAVGRYFTPKGQLLYGKCDKYVGTLNQTVNTDNVGEGLDAILREDVQGHNVEFWEDLQRLHDAPDYWDENGLSLKGKVKYQRLLEKYAEVLTRTEIIEETAKTYTKDTRALNNTGRCVYNTEQGNRCAVGRCLTEDAIEKYGKFDGWVYSLISKVGETHESFNDVLKPQYEGQPTEFWYDLQVMHDTPDYWDEDGLSPEGVKYKEKLLEKWK